MTTKYSYIVADDTIIAQIRKTKSRDEVKYAYQTCKEQINAAREFNLVNAQTARISNNMKYERRAEKDYDIATAREINAGEYLIITKDE